MADNLTRKQRSYCMSRVRSKDTALETRVQAELFRRGLRFRKHTSGLPGRPDIVFSLAKLAVFIDGDFWHGYRFPTWRKTVPKFWRLKIDKNRERDQRNFSKLRRMGWQVLRIWQHEIERDLSSCANRIASRYETARKTQPKLR